MLTYEEINKSFTYDPATGLLKRKKTRNSLLEGKEAGSYTKAGYREVGVKKNRLYVHRVAWMMTYKAWPDGHIDHINGIKDDNRIENLRVVNNQQNHTNMKQHKGNSSGVTGVYWSKRAKKWQAYICVSGKQKYLGVFKYLKDAETARKEAEMEYGFHKNHGRLDAGS